MPNNALYFFIDDHQFPLKSHGKKALGLIIKTAFKLNFPDLPYEGISAIYQETGRKVKYFDVALESPELLLAHPTFRDFNLTKSYHLSVDHNDLSHCTGEYSNENGERLILRVYIDAFGHVEHISLKHYAIEGAIEGAHIPMDTALTERIIQSVKPATDLFHRLVEKKWKVVLSLEKKLKRLDKEVALLWQGIETLSHDFLTERALAMQTTIEAIQDTLQTIDRYNDFGCKDPRTAIFQKHLEAIQLRASVKPRKSRAVEIEVHVDEEETPKKCPTSLPLAPAPLKVSLKQQLKREIQTLVGITNTIKKKELTLNNAVKMKNLLGQITEQLLIFIFMHEPFKADELQWIRDKETSIANNKIMLLNVFLNLFYTVLQAGNLDDVQPLLPHAMEGDDDDIQHCLEDLFNTMGECEDDELADRYIVMGEYLYNHSPVYRDFILSNNEQVNNDIRDVIDQRRYVENLLFALIFESSINEYYSPLLIKKLLAQVDLKTKCLALVNLLILPDSSIGCNLGYRLLSGVDEYYPEFFCTEAAYRQRVDERMAGSGGANVSLFFYNNNHNSSPCGVFDIAPMILQAIIDELLTLSLTEQRTLLERLRMVRLKMSPEFNRAVVVVAQVLNSIIAGVSNAISDAELMIELLDMRAAYERQCQVGWGLNFYAQALQMLEKFMEKYEGQPHRFNSLYTHIVKNIVKISDWERKSLVDNIFVAKEIKAIRERAKKDKSPVSADMGRNPVGLYTIVKGLEASSNKVPDISPDTVADSDSQLFLPINGAVS